MWGPWGRLPPQGAAEAATGPRPWGDGPFARAEPPQILFSVAQLRQCHIPRDMVPKVSRRGKKVFLKTGDTHAERAVSAREGLSPPREEERDEEGGQAARRGLRGVPARGGPATP